MRVSSVRLTIHVHMGLMLKKTHYTSIVEYIHDIDNYRIYYGRIVGHVYTITHLGILNRYSRADIQIGRLNSDFVLFRTLISCQIEIF